MRPVAAGAVALPLLLELTCAPLSAQRAGGAASLPDLDPYIARVLRTFDAPAMAVTIVKDGKVALARGYGIRRLGDTARVNADTRFGLGDNTKAFTATALAMLADRGTIPIDTPVVRFLPQFALADPYVTARITPRDLLAHRSGLGPGAGDLLWWPGTRYDRHEMVRRLRYLPLSSGFRSGFSPDNVLYLAAGELIEAVTRQTWEQFIAEELLTKLRMSNSTTRHSDATLFGNIAGTHTLVDHRASATPPWSNDAINPASGIGSTANDMARWMITQLNRGTTADSLRVWGGWAQNQLWTGVTPLQLSGESDAGFLRDMNAPHQIVDVVSQFALYALGMEVRDYRAARIVTPSGHTPG
jgi:CubicO group peptidase (beta-lactamase class C family)